MSQFLMEILKGNFFDLIQNNNVEALKNLLLPLPKSLVKVLVSLKVEGATPLLIAAKYGYYDVMKFLIDYCDANIEQTGKIEFDGETVNDVPPLWCASAAGHLECVLLLIRRGANVNSSTRTNSTPLRAACFDGHFEIVKLLVEQGADIEIANQHGHTCLMISCYNSHYEIAQFLIDRGCQINRQSCKGNTALHDCAESKNMDIMKLLVRNGALLTRDCFGVTPLMTAAIGGHLEMFNYLKSVFNCPIEDIVDAYKLLGATFVDKFFNLTEAVKYWKLALRLSRKCCPNYHETLVNNNKSCKMVFGGVTEFRTEAELDNMYCDPELMRLQALLIKSRVLSIQHIEVFYLVIKLGKNYIRDGDYAKCNSLYLYNLEQQIAHSKSLTDLSQNSYIAMIELFTLMSCNNSPHLKACDIFKVLKFAVNDLLVSCNISTKQYKDDQLIQMMDGKLLFKEDRHSMFTGILQGLDRQFLIVLHLLGFMCQTQPKLNYDELNQFKRFMFKFVSSEPRSTSSFSLLHILCILSASTYSMSSSEIPVFEIFKFIVDMSPNLDIVDICGNTPLHFLFESRPANLDMISYMLDAGAHLDLANQEGLTPLDLAQQNPQLVPYQVQHVSLQCLCAQVITRKRLSLPRQLPHDIRKFILEHNKKGQLSQISTC